MFYIPSFFTSDAFLSMLIIAIAIWFIIRELRLWYGKTNQIVASLKNIEDYLKLLVENTPYREIPDPGLDKDEATTDFIAAIDRYEIEESKLKFDYKAFFNRKIF